MWLKAAALEESFKKRLCLTTTYIRGPIVEMWLLVFVEMSAN